VKAAAHVADLVKLFAAGIYDVPLELCVSSAEAVF